MSGRGLLARCGRARKLARKKRPDDDRNPISPGTRKALIANDGRSRQADGRLRIGGIVLLDGKPGRSLR